MHLPSLPTACRTVVVLGFLLALAIAGRPGWTTPFLAMVLVGVWLAPLLVRHARHRAESALQARPAEAPAA
jgi:hypothetical protein